MSSGLVAVLLLAAGAGKLADVRGFQETLMLLRLPNRSSILLLPTAIIFELALGAPVLSGLEQRQTRLVLALVALSFLAVQIIGALSHSGAQCHCLGGLMDSRFGPISVLYSAAVAALACFGAAGTILGVDSPSPSMRQVFLVLATAALFAMGSWYAAKSSGLVKEALTSDGG